MIKKILLGLLLFVGVGLTSFSSAVQWKIIDVGESLMIPNNSIYSLRPVSSSIGILEGGGVSFPAIYNSIRWENLWFWNLSGELNFIYSNNGYYILNEPEYGCLYSADGFYDFDGDVLSYGACLGSGTMMKLSDFYRNPVFKDQMTRIGLISVDEAGVVGYGGFCFIYDGLDLSFCPASFPHEVVADNTSPGYSWLTNNPLDFDTSYIGNSPFDGGGGGSSTGGSIVNNYLCPTVGQLLSTYGSEYNTGLCYSSSLIYSGNSVVSVSPQSIFDLFSSQSEFINYRQLYSNNCNLSPMGDNTACENIFNGKNLQYSLISKIPGTINSLNLYSYCNLSLNQDPNTSTCVASGVYNTGVSSEDFINSIVNGNYQIISPVSGSITSDIIGSGDVFDGDILGSIQSIYSKFTSFFTAQTGNFSGILPSYIISMLLVIVLFRLFKK